MDILLWKETLRDLRRRRYLGVGEGGRREEDGAVEVEGRAGVSFDFAGLAFD